MKVIVAQALSALALMTVVGTTAMFAQPDPRLLSLVPPGSQLVVGVVAPRPGHPQANFMVFTRTNSLDLQDFFSIVGADQSHEIDQVIFTASAGHERATPEHSLLVSGRFDINHIYKSSKSTSAAKEYRGVCVVVQHPFERERALLNQDRLLAIIDSRLALFGTASSVQLEIDRYVSGTAADASISRRLSLLGNHNETWYLISSVVVGEQFPKTLKDLDPGFGDIDENTDTLLFGIRYGRQIEFEYVVSAHSNLPKDRISRRPIASLCNPVDGTSPLAADFFMGPSREFRRVVKISRERYCRWLDDLKLR